MNVVTTATASLGGNGFTNNKATTSSTTPGTQFQQGQQLGVQNAVTINLALTERLSRSVDATKTASSTTGQNLYGTGAGFIMTAQQLSNEFKPYTTTNGDLLFSMM